MKERQMRYTVGYEKENECWRYRTVAKVAKIAIAILH